MVARVGLSWQRVCYYPAGGLAASPSGPNIWSMNESIHSSSSSSGSSTGGRPRTGRRDGLGSSDV